MSAVEAWAAQITVEQLDEDPYPIYARMRREAPVCFVPAVGLWFVTRWADVELATTHPELIDSSVTPSPLDRVMGGPSILVLDGPPQKKLRAMLDPSMRPRVVESTSPQLVAAIVEERLDAIADRGEAELMSEYFEPVSVLSLGSVLGLGELDGDTLRRWFHGLALGAINFEDDPARWAVSDATGADIDRELAPVLERLWEAPDASMIATMLQHAEGSFDERVAAVLPTLKVILLGGMQEPGHAAGSTVAGLLESGQAAAVAADPGGLVRDAIEEGLRWVSPIGTQTRRALVETELGGVSAPGRRKSRGARLLGQSGRGDLGPDRRRVRPLPPETQSRRVRVRPSLLLGPSLLSCPDADRGAAALRAAPEPSARSRPAGRVQRLGVPGAAAPPRALGRLMADLGSVDLVLPISPTAISARRRLKGSRSWLPAPVSAT